MKTKSRTDQRRKRHRRVRRRITGTAERPRMAIMVSGRQMYVQFIDDEQGVTLAAASTKDQAGSNSVARATALGQAAAKVAGAKGITSVVCDRGGFRFHGRLKALVDAVVAAGVKVGSTRAPKPPKKEAAEGKDKA